MGMPSCIPIFILLLLSSSCKSEDTLTHTKPLFSGDKLVSNGGDFALGFFSPSSSNTSLYLGIWYNQIPDRRVVWIANRDNPITTLSAKLEVTNSSDMVLSDSQGSISWATKNSITTVGTRVAALLLDTGNFVLQFANGTYIWQSFDHPTDTILPTMKFLVSHKAQASGRLVAWKGPDDPSSGDFSCSGDPAFPDLQIIVWNGTRPYYRGVWNGQPVSGGLYLSNSSFVFVQTAVDQQDELFYSFTVSPGSPFALLMLDYTGKLTSLSWNNQSSSWVVVASHPDPDVVCDIYSSCGPFGYCDLTTGGSMCQCLDGFEPVDVNNVSKGCQRKETVKCGKRAQFVTLPQMKVPDKFLHIPNRSFEECAADCSANCSCTAYAYANFSHSIAKADMSRCLVWREELIDTEKYSSDSFFTAGKSVTSGENLYLRLAHSPGKKNNLPKIVLPVVACLLICVCITLIKILTYRGKQQKKEIQRRHILGYFNSSNGITHKNTEFPFVSFEDIAAATEDFSDSNLIGRGGFGKVYKGVLDGGEEVAIKRLSENSKQGIDEFKNEIVLFAKLQHKNLVRLLGCCIHGDERLLIYEYLPNKSLDAFVFGQYMLDWPTRFKIIKGVARGLLYLHQDSRLTIVHRDLKASNILLDKDMNPKISDFGMARIFCENQEQANTTRLVGTYGYMSPEYVIGGSFSVKSDTYSFGVLILEIVSGMKISSPQLRMDFSSLPTFAWKLWQDGNARELVDSLIVDSCPLDEVLRCIHVALLCVEDCPDDRPLMSSVIFVLENGSVLLPAPKQPLYFCSRNKKADDARKNVENSMNGMSTTLEGR